MKVYMKQKRATRSEAQKFEYNKKKAQYMKEYWKQKHASETQNSDSKKRKHNT